MSWRRGERPNPKRWAVVRLAVLGRDGWVCQRCGGWGNQCDHIKPLFKDGPLYDTLNLQCLCAKCHWAKTKSELRLAGPSPELDAWEARLKASTVILH